MAEPRVTIGMPVYNGEQFLRQALDSILAQTYTNFELIISDNCSTDQTASICQEYAAKDARIRYIRQQQNRGATPNFNLLVPLARGAFFKWAAHDDVIAPTYLERCMAVLEADESVVLCHTDTQLINQRGEPLKPLNDGSNHFFDDQGRIVYLGKDSPDRKFNSVHADERLEAVIMHTDWVYEIFGVFRIEPLKRTKLMESFYGGDKLLLAKLVTLGRVVLVRERLFLNRRHPDQSMSLATIEGQEMWIDVNANHSGFAHRVKRMRGFLNAALLMGNMSIDERLGCISVIIRYYVRLKRWHDMFEEITGLRDRRLSEKAVALKEKSL